MNPLQRLLPIADEAPAAATGPEAVSRQEVAHDMFGRQSGDVALVQIVSCLSPCLAATIRLTLSRTGVRLSSVLTYFSAQWGIATVAYVECVPSGPAWSDCGRTVGCGRPGSGWRMVHSRDGLASMATHCLSRGTGLLDTAARTAASGLSVLSRKLPDRYDQT